jgi:hypothetical protein
MSTVACSLESLTEAIRQWSPGTSIQEETSQIVSVLHLGSGDVPVFVRVLPDSDLLQIIAFFPCELISSAIGDLGRFLHLINKGLDRPGLGIDEVFKVVFYRIVLPYRDRVIELDILQETWNAMEGVIETFTGSIRPVAQGDLCFQEVISMLAHGDPT